MKHAASSKAEKCQTSMPTEMRLQRSCSCQESSKHTYDDCNRTLEAKGRWRVTCRIYCRNRDVAVNPPAQRQPPSPPARRLTMDAAPPRAQALPVDRPAAPRAPPIQTVRATHQTAALGPQPKQSKSREDDYELLDDDDDFDEEALAVLQAAEAADSSRKLREAGSATSRTTSARSSVQPSTIGPSRGVGLSTKAPATSRTAARPSHMPGRAAQVIDLDDSDEDEDETVALMLLSSDGPLEASGDKPKAHRSTVPPKGLQPRRNEPIEID